MIVYVRQNCSHSAAVLSALEHLKLDVNIKYIEDPKVERELLAHGRIQVPFMIDEKYETELYDSNLILHYLDEHYGEAKS